MDIDAAAAADWLAVGWRGVVVMNSFLASLFYENQTLQKFVVKPIGKEMELESDDDGDELGNLGSK